MKFTIYDLRFTIGAGRLPVASTNACRLGVRRLAGNRADTAFPHSVLDVFHFPMNLKGQEGRADIILTPHPQSLPMNPGDPHLTLALSPPIRWERRGNPPSPRLRRTGSRRMAAVARKSGRMRQVQGGKARIFRGILSPLRGEGSHHRRTWENLGFMAPMRVHSWRLKLPKSACPTPHPPHSQMPANANRWSPVVNRQSSIVNPQPLSPSSR